MFVMLPVLRFNEIKSREDFVRRVPLTKQSDIAPYCHMIARGEKNVLTREDPVMMALTTGTTGANCPIPVIASSADIGRTYTVIVGRLRFHYENDKEYENEIFVCWHHHFLCSSWVPIRYCC